MADAPKVSTAFPAPPIVFRLYNAENSGLAPPPIPTDSFTTFGQIHQIHEQPPSLSEFNVPQLFPSSELDYVKVLKELNHALMFNYFELVDVLIEKPDEFKHKLEQLHFIFSNMHHLLNDFRPHEARENLKNLARMQLRQRQELGVNLTTSFAQAELLLEQCNEVISTPSTALPEHARSSVGISTATPSLESKRESNIMSDEQAMLQLLQWAENQIV